MSAAPHKHPAITKLRKLCLALPEAVEIEAWGHPTFRSGKKMFCACGVDGKVASCTFKVDPTLREFLLGNKSFFVPAYVGNRGWLGCVLNSKTNWKQLGDLVLWSFKQTAPKKLLKAHGLSC